MKPAKIMDIMNIARRARQLGEVFNPLFVGPPGVGKSQIVQSWCVINNLPFIDLRSAYLEAPDVIGFPSIENVDGRQTTVHNTPEFWPTDPEWEGVVLLEEPNRGTTSILNCWMQLLTDRKVHKYTLPKNAIIVGCINPEGAEYDVNSMDAALKDRFEMFQVTYDRESFVSFIKQSNWHKDLVLFIDNGLWGYVEPESIKNAPGSKYVSPRTLSKLNAVLKCGFEKEDEMLLYTTVLGTNIGKDFYNFRHNESPVFYYDLLNDLPTSLAKLKKFSDPNDFKNGMISITVKDIIDNGKIGNDLLVEVLRVLPADQGIPLIRDLQFKRQDSTTDHKLDLLGDLCKEFPDLKALFKSVLKFEKIKR